jgi:23S rRNA pseudouridine1911/1915/1917 synthase
MPRIEARVPPGQEGRADRFISSRLGALSRSQIKARGAELRVNGRAAKLSRELKAGDVVELSWEEEAPMVLEAEDLPLSILFENHDVLVVNKAQGMVSHPAAGNWSGTLVNAALGHARRSGSRFNFPSDTSSSALYRPGIVHRLDKDTSGVIILAKSPQALAFLAAQFADHSARKRYIAIVHGRPPQPKGLIEGYLARSPSDRKRFAVSKEGQGKLALTRYRQIRAWGSDYALLSLEPRTGRTHQLRVHMRFLGCPILGDPIYGRKDRRFPGASLMLHAYRLRIILPGEKGSRLFTAPLPPRFSRIIKDLDKEKGC